MAYTDDESIEDADNLLRRVINPHQVVFDDNLNRKRPSSRAFDNHADGSPMSICIEKDLFALGENYESILSNQTKQYSYAIASFTAGIARENQQIIAREEVEGEFAHGVVCGNKTRSIKRNIAKACEWAISPDDE